MAVEGLGTSTFGIAFLVGAGVMYEIMAAAASSPQTTEINAKTRSKTLMKWVDLGVAQGTLFILVAAYFDRKNAVPIIAGGAMAAVILYGSYIHAKQAGMKSTEPSTEDVSKNFNAFGFAA